jgi:DNA-directed RNA polymerase subunit E'/Rpb7
MVIIEEDLGKQVQILSDVLTVDNNLAVKKGSIGVVVGDGFGYYDIKFNTQETIQVVFASHCKLINY